MKLNWLQQLFGGKLYVVHRWDQAISNGAMDPNSTINGDLYSKFLIEAFEEYGLDILPPMLWSGVYCEN